MKNMFFVINKEKIYAYVVSIMTIVTIFFMSSLINSDLKETEVTSSNSIENNAIEEAVSTSTPYEANTDTEEENETNKFSEKDTVQINESNKKTDNN